MIARRPNLPLPWLLALPCLLAALLLSAPPAHAQGGFVPAQNIVKGTATGQTTRWDNTLNKWVPVSTVTVDGSGNLVAAGTITSAGSVLANYTLPTASATTLGGVKVGSGLSINVSGVLSATGGGTVTSVGLSVPGLLYSVSGSPVTGSGTLTETLVTQTANKLLAGPASGSAATPTFRSLVGADLTGTGLASNNTQVAMGGSVDTGSRLAIAPSGTAEHGLSVTMPSGATGNALQVRTSVGATVATIDASGNVSAVASGSSTTSPRILGVGSLASGNAGRIQFGDQYNCLQANYGGRMTVLGYWGIEIRGNTEGGNNGFIAGGPGDPSLRVIGTLPNAPVLVSTGAGSQTGDYFQCTSSAGIVRAKVDSSFVVTANGYVSAIAAKTANYTLTASDSTVTVTGTTTITLPDATTCAGRTYTEKDMGTGTVTIATTSSQTIDAATSITLSTQYQSRTETSTGTNWVITGGYL